MAKETGSDSSYNPRQSEAKWRDYWEKHGIYRFDPQSSKPVFSVDTPPPYVSAANLHVGHAMSYSQAEFVIRFRRMQGYNIFYPMGFDDNGLPTERFVEKKYKIDKGKTNRKDFINLCLKETAEGAKTYRELWRNLGVSVDWTLEYSTINAHCQKVSQQSFIDLFEKGFIVRKKDPMIWCTRCQTALAQADVSMEEQQGQIHSIVFSAPNGDPLTISTTRPELIPACVALYVHPDDQRYSSLVGKKAVVPIVKREVPILTDAAVEMDFGTGLMMVCTWGDAEDVRKWREHQLESRAIINANGVLNEAAGPYAGMHLVKAREAILNDLKTQGLLKETKSLHHNVGLHENCGTPIDFYATEQWFIRVLDFKEELLGRGEELKWFPKFMHVRYQDWVKNLKWDWCISRSRFYGVPFPVWYCSKCGQTQLAARDQLPVDPMSQAPSSKACAQCGNKEFKAETDVMDTWMTSSVTPLINAHWPDNKSLMEQIYPMSIRVQAFEIIRTWLFYTVAKSHFHTRSLPWKSVMISGWGLDDKGRKMSKSLGNVIAPETVIQKYSADALRFWAAGSALGRDMRYSESDVKDGNRLVTKLWNAFKLIFPTKDTPPKVVTVLSPEDVSGLTDIDRWMLSELQRTVKQSTEAFEECEYSHARNVTARYFWDVFCDNYLEFVKGSLWGNEGYTQADTVRTQHVLSYAGWTILRLFAPFVPYITEELFQKYYATTGISSVHIAPWPTVERIWENEESEKVGQALVDVVTQVRRFKTEAKLSPAAPLHEVIIDSKAENALAEIKKADKELKHVLRAQKITYGTPGSGAPFSAASATSRFSLWVVLPS